MPLPTRYQLQLSRIEPDAEDQYWEAWYNPNTGGYYEYSTWTAANAELLLKRIAAERENPGHYAFRIVDLNTGRIISRIPIEELSAEERSAEKKHMVNIKFVRKNGKLFLCVNAQGLHETLDLVGVQSDGSPLRYKDRPYATDSVLNVSSLVISTELFLNKTYPVEVDLSSVFTSPPTVEQLKKLAQSGYEQVRKILEHYQPIDIQVDIQKKILKEAS